MIGGLLSARTPPDASQVGNSASDSLIVLAGRIGMVITGVAVQSCLAWFLLPAGRGSYAVCVMFASVTAVILSLGIDRAVQYFISTSQRTLSQVVADLLGFYALAALVGIPLGLGLLRLDLAIWDKAEHRSFVLMLCFAPLNGAQLALRWALIGTRSFRQFTYSNLMTLMVQLVATVVFLKVFTWGVDGALLALMVSVLAANAYMLGVLWRQSGLRIVSPSVSGIKQLLGYGLRYYVASLGSMANTRIGMVLVAFFLSPVEIGYFAVAVAIVVQASMIADSVEVAVLPRMAADKPRRGQLAAQASRMTLLATGVLVVILAVFCRPVVSLLFSQEFLPSVPLILIILPALLLWSASKMLLAYFMSSDRPEVASWAVGIGIAANMISLLLLLPTLGTAGAAWAMAIGFATRALAAAIAFHAASGVGVRAAWLPGRRDISQLKQYLRVASLRRVRSEECD